MISPILTWKARGTNRTKCRWTTVLLWSIGGVESNCVSTCNANFVTRSYSVIEHRWNTLYSISKVNNSVIPSVSFLTVKHFALFQWIILYFSPTDCAARNKELPSVRVRENYTFPRKRWANSNSYRRTSSHFTFQSIYFLRIFEKTKICTEMNVSNN